MINIPKLAVCAIIKSGDGYVGVSRKFDDTKWGLPGGKVDAGEGVVTAIQRELYEEIGCKFPSSWFAPIYVGLSDGEVQYWVTTFVVDLPYPFDITNTTPEAGISIKNISKEELCSYNVSPFAAYNRSMFQFIEESQIITGV